MKYGDLENKDINELNEMLKDAKVKLGKLKFELANKALKDFSQIRKARIEIAKLLTAINRINSK
jgi:ribosomal protein L29